MARTVSTIAAEQTLDPLALPEAKPVLRLIEAHQAGRETAVENCFFCRLPIEMESFENVSFRWHCPCGKSDGFLSGI